MLTQIRFFFLFPLSYLSFATHLKQCNQRITAFFFDLKCFLEVDHNAALLLKVNGFIHTGYVLIVLNSSDLYDIYLSKTMNLDSFKLAIDDVYCDQLTEIIDSLIERGNMSDKDYNEKVKIWFKEL